MWKIWRQTERNVKMGGRPGRGGPTLPAPAAAAGHRHMWTWRSSWPGAGAGVCRVKGGRWQKGGLEEAGWGTGGTAPGIWADGGGSSALQARYLKGGPLEPPAAPEWAEKLSLGHEDHREKSRPAGGSSGDHSLSSHQGHCVSPDLLL